MSNINVFGRTKFKGVIVFAPLLVVLIATPFFGVFLSPVAGQTTVDPAPSRIVSNEMELRTLLFNATFVDMRFKEKRN